LSAGSSFGTSVPDPSGNEGSDTNEELESGGESSTVGRVGYKLVIDDTPERGHTDFGLVNWNISIV